VFEGRNVVVHAIPLEDIPAGADGGLIGWHPRTGQEIWVTMPAVLGHVADFGSMHGRATPGPVCTAVKFPAVCKSCSPPLSEGSATAADGTLRVVLRPRGTRRAVLATSRAAIEAARPSPAGVKGRAAQHGYDLTRYQD
jgi:hypothetical protein